MAWKEVLPMDERVRFVLEVEKAEESVADLCRVYGISRKTGYKWIGRYEAEGMEGMRERLRRPKQSPNQTSLEWVKRILYQRVKHPKWGPKKLRKVLKEQGYSGPLPAVSTMGQILDRAGLVVSRKKRRKSWRGTSGPLTKPDRPNQVWAVDYKGWFRTRDGMRCEPLTISDVFSRYVLEARVVAHPTYEEARKAFEKVFRTYGLPDLIRSDNGSPFASRGVGGLSRLSVWWMLQGIRVELIRPGHPEENGSHERMHLTMKQDTCCPPAAHRRAQQKRFNRWRQEFNDERPHEALGMDRPIQHYRSSERRHTGKLKQPIYDVSHRVRRVRSNGEIKWRGRRRFIGEALKGVLVGLKEIEPGWHQAYFGSVLLGSLHDTDVGGLRPSVSVLPTSVQEETNSVTYVPG